MAFGLLVTRHGRTSWAAERRLAGRTDLPLVEEGRAEAAALGRYLANREFHSVFTSPLRRCVETARLVFPNVVPVLDDRLLELDLGAWDGRTYAEVERDMPESYAALTRDPAQGRFPGGESLGEGWARVGAFLREREVSGVDGVVAVVAHNTLLRLAIAAMLGLPLDQYRRRLASLGNCFVTEFALCDPGWRLQRFNVPPRAG